MVLELQSHDPCRRQGWGVRCRSPSPVSLPAVSQAEYYVAGQVGVNFADRLTGIQGTGSFVTLGGPDLDLKNAVVYGGKLGFFPNNGAMGLELDVFNSQPNSRISTTFPVFISA